MNLKAPLALPLMLRQCCMSTCAPLLTAVVLLLGPEVMLLGSVEHNIDALGRALGQALGQNGPSDSAVALASVDKLHSCYTGYALSELLRDCYSDRHNLGCWPCDPHLRTERSGVSY